MRETKSRYGKNGGPGHGLQLVLTSLRLVSQQPSLSELSLSALPLAAQELSVTLLRYKTEYNLRQNSNTSGKLPVSHFPRGKTEKKKSMQILCLSVPARVEKKIQIFL